MVFRRPKNLHADEAPSVHSSANAPEPFVVRQATPKDLNALHELSRHLNSVNLPNDKAALRKILETSRASFSGKIDDPFRRQYLFALQGVTSGQIAGTSMLFSQHGHPDAPHVFFDVLTDERYSITLDRHFHHLCLRLGFNFRGPTEIGGLVLDPAMRSRGLGKLLSFSRFLFIAMYRELFRPTVIAELMPPLTPDGKSELWECFGRHFTGLSYQDADKLSRSNKEFILSLFPQTPIYASLFPQHVQKLIGAVGDSSLGVKRMLEAIGFTYSERIDPFDGGPHFEAMTDSIRLVSGAQRLIVGRHSSTADVRVIAASGGPKGPSGFLAGMGLAELHGDRVALEPSLAGAIGARPGQAVWVTPIDET
ncbi:MAG: arginine N-succinyltransferase [Deltaproteobacteria bacterium]|nr:arginine N-succinyltransferase [Deltaproteobacteria bacterium]